MRTFFRICGLTLVNVLFILCFVPMYSHPSDGVNPAQNTFYYLAAFLLSFWQPWLIFFVLFGFCCGFMAAWFSPFLVPLIALAFLVGSAAVTHKIYGGLYYRSDKLDGLLRLGPRWIGALVVGLLCVGALVSLGAYKDFPVRYKNTPPLPDLSGPNARFALTDNFYYEDPALPRRSVRFIWRTHIARAEMPLLARYLQMRPADASILGDTFWAQPPYWWRPSSGTVETYATPHFSEGSPVYSVSGRSYMDFPYISAVYEPQSETLYVKGEFLYDIDGIAMLDTTAISEKRRDMSPGQLSITP